MVEDSDPGVRLQVAYSLGEMKPEAAGVALARLLRADDDRFIRAAAMSSALPHADTIIAHLQANGRGDDPLLIEVAAVTENAKALASLLSAIASSTSRADPQMVSDTSANPTCRSTSPKNRLEPPPSSVPPARPSPRKRASNRYSGSVTPSNVNWYGLRYCM